MRYLAHNEQAPGSSGSTELTYHGTIPYALRNNDEAQIANPATNYAPPQETSRDFAREQNTALSMLHTATEPDHLKYHGSVPHAIRVNQFNESRPVSSKPLAYSSQALSTNNHLENMELQYPGMMPFTLRDQNNNVPMPVLRPAPINPDRLGAGNNFRYDPPVIRVRHNPNEPAPIGLRYPGTVPYAYRLEEFTHKPRVDSSSLRLRNRPTSQSIPLLNRPQAPDSPKLHYPGTVPYAYRVDPDQPITSQPISRESTHGYSVTIGGLKSGNEKKKNSNSKNSNQSKPTASVQIGVWETIHPVEGRLSNRSQQRSSGMMPGYKAFNQISSYDAKIKNY